MSDPDWRLTNGHRLTPVFSIEKTNEFDEIDLKHEPVGYSRDCETCDVELAAATVEELQSIVDAHTADIGMARFETDLRGTD